MPKIKKVAAIAVSAGISVGTVFGFAGCEKEDPTKDSVNSNPPVVDPSSPVKPDPTPENPPIVDPEKPDDKEKEEEAKKAFETVKSNFDDFVASLQTMKFAYDVENFNTSIIVNENVIKMNDVFYENTGDMQFEYKLQDDQQYHKAVYDINENVDQFATVVKMLKNFNKVSWTSLKENKVLEGNFADKSVTYQQQNGAYYFTVDGVGYKYHDIGITISLPASFIDDTRPIESDKLYDAQGNLNYAVFAKTIKDWMNDGYYVDKISASSVASLINIDYVDIDEKNNITFGAYVKARSGGEMKDFYQNFNISSKELANKIIAAEFVDVESFTTYLNSLKGTPIVIKDGKEIDTSITYENLEKMAKNILSRLAEVGYQEGSINNEGTKVIEYDAADILSVRKSVDVSKGSTLDMGRASASDFNILVKKSNGQLENLTFSVYYKIDNAAQNVLNDVPDSWIIRSYTSMEIDYCPYTENIAQHAFVGENEIDLTR